MSAALLVGGALLLDLAVGDPDRPGHPVRLAGRFAGFVEARLRPGASRPFRAGLLGWFIVVGLSSAVALGFIVLAELAGGLLGARRHAHDLAGMVLLYVAIAPRDLARHALAVATGLKEAGIEGGRKAVGRIVGRDVDRLDEEGVVKACVESVAESAVDGVAAPIFWALVLGPVGAIAYRAANTLDSMWGHKDKRYMLYGRFAAKADDVANWIPARLAFFAAFFAAFFLRLDARSALFIGWRDRRKHESPNAAWLEASFAAALGLGLGGPAWYSGERLEKPVLGEARRPPEPRDITRSVALMYGTTLVFSALSIALRSLFP